MMQRNEWWRRGNKVGEFDLRGWRRVTRSEFDRISRRFEGQERKLSGLHTGPELWTNCPKASQVIEVTYGESYHRRSDDRSVVLTMETITNIQVVSGQNNKKLDPVGILFIVEVNAGEGAEYLVARHADRRHWIERWGSGTEYHACLNSFDPNDPQPFSAPFSNQVQPPCPDSTFSGTSPEQFVDLMISECLELGTAVADLSLGRAALITYSKRLGGLGRLLRGQRTRNSNEVLINAVTTHGIGSIA